MLRGYDDHDLLTFASAIAFQVLTAVVPVAVLLTLVLIGITIVYIRSLMKEDEL